jgi:hypothetical protein
MAEKLVPIWVPESEYAAALLKLYGDVSPKPPDEVTRLVAERSRYGSRTREYGAISARIRRLRLREPAGGALWPKGATEDAN